MEVCHACQKVKKKLVFILSICLFGCLFVCLFHNYNGTVEATELKEAIAFEGDLMGHVQYILPKMQWLL